MEPQQRVAIVGSGLAGLVSAYLLHNDRQQRFAVKVFESVCEFCSVLFFFPVNLGQDSIDSLGNFALPRCGLHIRGKCLENIERSRGLAYARLCRRLL